MDDMTPSFDSFLSFWGESFHKVHQGLTILSDYPIEQLGEFHPGRSISFEQRINLQQEWHKNLSGMEELDKSFFQYHWVPVQEDLSQWFIDLSDPNFAVIAGYFVDTEPQGWYRNVIANSLAELILAFESGTTGTSFFKKETQGQLDIYFRVLEVRNEQIYNGTIENPPLTIEEAFTDFDFPRPFSMPCDGKLVLHNARPLSIGIFPPDTDIALSRVMCEEPGKTITSELKQVTKIRQLVFLLRKYYQLELSEFQVNLINSDVIICFDSNTNELVVIGLSQESRQGLIGSLNNINLTF